MRLLEWAIIQSDWCPYTKRNCGLTETPGCAYAEGRQCEHPERRRPPASQGERPWEKPKLQTPCFQTSRLENCEKIHFCCVSLPGCGRISCQPWKTHATGVGVAVRLHFRTTSQKMQLMGEGGQAWRSSSCFTFPEVGDVGGRERCFLPKYLFCLLWFSHPHLPMASRIAL